MSTRVDSILRAFRSAERRLPCIVLCGLAASFPACRSATWTRFDKVDCAQTFTVLASRGFQVYEYLPQTRTLAMRGESAGRQTSQATFSCALGAVITGYSYRGWNNGSEGLEVIGDHVRRDIPLRDGFNAFMPIGSTAYVEGSLHQPRVADSRRLVDASEQEPERTAEVLDDPISPRINFMTVDLRTGTLVRRVTLPFIYQIWDGPDGSLILLVSGGLLKYSTASGTFGLAFDFAAAARHHPMHCPYFGRLELVGEHAVVVYGDLSPSAPADAVHDARCLARSIYVYDESQQRYRLQARLGFRPELVVSDRRRVLVFDSQNVVVFDPSTGRSLLRTGLAPPGHRVVAGAPIAAGYVVLWSRPAGASEIVLYSSDFSRILARRALPEGRYLNLSSEDIPQPKSNRYPPQPASNAAGGRARADPACGSLQWCTSYTMLDT